LVVAVGGSDGGQWNETTLRLGLFEDVLTIERFHASVVRRLLELLVTGPELFFARRAGDTQLIERVVAVGLDMRFVQLELVAALSQAHGLAACEDLVAAMLVIPLGQRGRHVHLLDNVAPPHAGVIRTETDLALLRSVGDDALLGATEIVVVEVLEP